MCYAFLLLRVCDGLFNTAVANFDFMGVLRCCMVLLGSAETQRNLQGLEGLERLLWLLEVVYGFSMCLVWSRILGFVAFGV